MAAGWMGGRGPGGRAASSPCRRVAGWGGSGGEGRPPPGIYQRNLLRCFQSE